jgi:hydrogenase/urease accessory protein HupE
MLNVIAHRFLAVLHFLVGLISIAGCFHGLASGQGSIEAWKESSLLAFFAIVCLYFANSFLELAAENQQRREVEFRRSLN